jgi:hypothetical protein
MKRLALIYPLFAATPLLAQTPTPNAGDAAAAAAGGIFALGINCVIWGISLALWLAAAIWVTKDAKRRNSPNATLVTVLTWIPCTWLIGLIVHLVTRPKNLPGTTIPPAV